MLQSHFSIYFFAPWLFAGALAAGLNISGDAIVSRNWDCCKPSCSWKNKADVNQPVQACGIDGKAADPDAGSGCNDAGIAYECPSQQSWAVNDTFAYGFVAAWIEPNLAEKKTEDAWCCACYELEFKAESLKGKRMVVQATNTLFDKKDYNRFSLAIPGNNFTVTYAPNTCNTQYGLPIGSFNQTNFGVSYKENCSNVPEPLRPGCQWRFDWYNNDDFNNATFKRVVCPAELTNKSTCIRNDDKQLAQGSATTSFATNLSPVLSFILSVAGLVGFFSL